MVFPAEFLSYGVWDLASGEIVVEQRLANLRFCQASWIDFGPVEVGCQLSIRRDARFGFPLMRDR